VAYKESWFDFRGREEEPVILPLLEHVLYTDTSIRKEADHQRENLAPVPKRADKPNGMQFDEVSGNKVICYDTLSLFVLSIVVLKKSYISNICVLIDEEYLSLFFFCFSLRANGIINPSLRLSV